MKDWISLKYSAPLVYLAAMILLMPAKASGHNFIGKVGCFECHDKLPIQKAAVSLKPDIEKVCFKCHNLEKQLIHPVDITPKISIPSDMPLDKMSRITCVTCHDVHMSAVNKLTGRKTFYLRRAPKGKKFCYSCHAKLPV